VPTKLCLNNNPENSTVMMLQHQNLGCTSDWLFFLQLLFNKCYIIGVEFVYLLLRHCIVATVGAKHT